MSSMLPEQLSDDPGTGARQRFGQAGGGLLASFKRVLRSLWRRRWQSSRLRWRDPMVGTPALPLKGELPRLRT